MTTRTDANGPRWRPDSRAVRHLRRRYTRRTVTHLTRAVRDHITSGHVTVTVADEFMTAVAASDLARVSELHRTATTTRTTTIYVDGQPATFTPPTPPAAAAFSDWFTTYAALTDRPPNLLIRLLDILAPKAPATPDVAVAAAPAPAQHLTDVAALIHAPRPGPGTGIDRAVTT